MIDEIFRSTLGELLSEHLQVKIQINYAESVRGGDINATYRLFTTHGDFFLKVNDARLYPDMFFREYEGLTILRHADAIKVPTPILQGNIGEQAFLVTDFLAKGRAVPDFWENFAASLARLHQHTQPQFGLAAANYIGSLRQYNSYYSTWPVFYAFNRLMPLARQAYDQQLFDKTMMEQMEQLCKQLPSIFPDEPPALLHGDMWSGNFMVGPEGRAAIYDPAVYYGNREMDLAMARLFGGFDTRFYYTYQAIFPLQQGWQQRIGICQLYPLLVHLQLFGESYRGSIKEVLNAF